MSEGRTRILDVEEMEVRCLPGKREHVDRCRFCVHSKKIPESGRWKVSPARAYCVLSRSDDVVDMNKAEAVECDDMKGEGFRSILNVIS